MTNQKILDNAPEGATHHAQGMHYLALNNAGNWMRYDNNGFAGAKWFEANDFKFSYVKSFRSLADIKRIAELDSLINSRVFPSMGDGFSGDYVCGYERALADMCRALKEQGE